MPDTRNLNCRPTPGTRNPKQVVVTNKAAYVTQEIFGNEDDDDQSVRDYRVLVVGSGGLSCVLHLGPKGLWSQVQVVLKRPLFLLKRPVECI